MKKKQSYSLDIEHKQLSRKLRDENYQQRKQQQLKILALLEQKLRNRFQQKVQKNVQSTQRNYKESFRNNKIQSNTITPKIAPIKKIKQFESSQSEYEYAEPIEFIHRKELHESKEIECETSSVKTESNEERKWISLEEKFLNEAHLSKKDSLRKKKIIKGIDEPMKNKLKQKLPQNQQPLSPPSSIELFQPSEIRITKEIHSEYKVKPITQSLILKPQISKMSLKSKKEQVPIDSEYSEYELSSKPREIKLNFRKQNKKQTKNQNEKQSLKQKEKEKERPQKIVLQDQKQPQKVIIKEPNKNDKSIKQNLNQIYKFQQKEKQQIIKTIKNPPKMTKTQITHLSTLQRSNQDKQKHSKVSFLAKIFIEEEYSFNNLRKKKKNGSLPLILKEIQLGEFGNLSTYLIKTTIREIQKQLIQKCKLHLKKLSSQEFNFIRTPLLRAKQIMPKDHLNTFLSIVGYAFKLNLTFPSEKDVIALYQFILIKLQEQMKNKEFQKTQNLEKEVRDKSLKSNQKTQSSKSKETSKSAKKSNSVFNDPFKRSKKPKETEEEKDNFEEEDFLKKLEDFVKTGKKNVQ